MKGVVMNVNPAGLSQMHMNKGLTKLKHLTSMVVKENIITLGAEKLSLAQELSFSNFRNAERHFAENMDLSINSNAKPVLDALYNLVDRITEHAIRTQPHNDLTQLSFLKTLRNPKIKQAVKQFVEEFDKNANNQALEKLSANDKQKAIDKAHNGLFEFDSSCAEPKNLSLLQVMRDNLRALVKDFDEPGFQKHIDSYNTATVSAIDELRKIANKPSKTV